MIRVKNKVLLGLLIIFSSFVIGCESKNIENNNSNNSTKEEQKSNIKIGNIPVELDMGGLLSNMSYKIPSKASSSNLGTYAIADLMDGSDLLVRVALSTYAGKAIGDVMNGSKLSSAGVSEFNGYTWNVYSGKQEDGKNILNYVTQVSDDSYSIAFISDKDINNFINEFMKNVKFN